MFDVIQIVFWSITYIFIIIAGVQSRKIRKPSIPYAACVGNFCWEFCALMKSGGFWGHILWFLLDCFIIIATIRYTKIKGWLGHIVIGILVFGSVFRLGGMLILCFVIDLVMAFLFVCERKNLSDKWKIPIAITKLIGDTFAGLYYYKESKFVLLIAVIVLILNILYLILCIKEKIVRI